ncbi:phosphoribosylformylglycinamidine synthase subunit PurS [Pelotomaculum isophthalicicum JI]|uniref:Phosphoribosylformylglycinamidine synthase subunit PurL n=1 Tax=Pelotomaculum isophthalicicum JI TaxID=947010 RepID=A0A9X4H3H4_9FIRM|nr:phosphoribosylformylglycinamidine synthase subunit PurS [Pelotomaculum isophthalicicum]MDF9406947.1 phosphoribosylformylglycinamidine synthase subunit PurS [Pelotomaculum isophthalicicum JI]
MMIQEVRVITKAGIPDSKGEEILYEISHALGINTVQKVRTARVFRFEGIGASDAALLAERLLAESVFQDFSVNSPVINDATIVLEVAYKPGVMNPEAASIVKSAADLGVAGLLAADSSWEYGFYGENITGADIERITSSLLVNATVEYVVREKPKTLIIQGKPGRTEVIPVRQMSDTELIELSRDKLFLNLEEMQVIKDYFRRIGRDPTDCEIETIAQTWSEHCGHKTFKARLIVDGKEKTPLLKRLKNATEESNHPLVLSAFVDNSGVMEFYDGQAICGKVETHNSPSAIEPYGGAMTGSGGVFRDIVGTGRGAKTLASTDMFCFARPDTPDEDIPAGCLHPHYLLRRVVAGVRDYGNRMGIPTNNGSVHFHRDFRAKPTVIVGAYGILPAELCRKGRPRAGDLVIALGGRTGRDGIHGATFSSGEMTDRTIDVNSSAVQIGHPIEEKRTFDAILVARDEGLIRAITDCGAGGFASAVGEMGSEVGARIALDRAPLKYPGLSPWEIMESESQERMVLAVDPEHAGRLMEICRGYNVEATVLGEFTGDKCFSATYEGQVVMNLEMEFLHNGLPQRVMNAAWRPACFAEPEAVPAADWEDLYCRVMGHLNVCSKEPIVRLYDHGVQGTSALPPFSGINGDGPNDAAIMAPILGKPYGMVISHGLNPVLNMIDPYHGSLWAAAEAVSNAIASGVNPRDLMLMDNFIWPFPDEELLGALDLAVDACVDFVRGTGMPFISGKDSLSSTYRGKDGTVIKIPPILCISAFGRVPDVSRTVSADFKKTGTKIVLAGYRNTAEMAGSVYYDLLGHIGNNLPKLSPTALMHVFEAVYGAINSGKLLACHDISEGGVAAALAEMCFGGDMGAQVIIPEGELAENFLFNETAGCFLAEIPADSNPSDIFGDIPCQVIGKTTDRKVIAAEQSGKTLFETRLDRLRAAWRQPMKEVFRQ